MVVKLVGNELSWVATPMERLGCWLHRERAAIGVSCLRSCPLTGACLDLPKVTATEELKGEVRYV